MTDPGFDSHVLVIAGSGIFIVGRYIEFGTLSDRYIFVSLGIASADLGPFLQRVRGSCSFRWERRHVVQYPERLPRGDLHPSSLLPSHYR